MEELNIPQLNGVFARIPPLTLVRAGTHRGTGSAYPTVTQAETPLELRSQPIRLRA